MNDWHESVLEMTNALQVCCRISHDVFEYIIYIWKILNSLMGQECMLLNSFKLRSCFGLLVTKGALR